MAELKTKPLGKKSYGHIGHLPDSRLGPGDHKVSPGQARIACEKLRDKNDRVIVQEKLDGSNVGVVLKDGEILALTRSGYLATTSPYEQHHIFAAWVRKNEQRFREVLREGERVCGEWLLQAHGTRYRLEHEPFVAFDLFSPRPGAEEKREPYDRFLDRLGRHFNLPYCMSTIVEGHGVPISVKEALEFLGPFGKHGAQDPIEGAVWRVERRTRLGNYEVDFLCKYVRPDKADGCFLPEVSGKPPVWNVDPKELLR